MAKKDEKRRERILNGNLWGVIISICAPLFVYQLFNAFYNLIDTIFANAISTDSVSSVAALGQVKNLLTSFGAGIAAGGGIIVARRFGGNDINSARKNANVCFTLVLVVSIVLMLICIPLAYPICSISGISKDQASRATGYFSVQMAEVMIVALNSVFIAMEKSKGNTRIIFVLNIVAMAVKLLLNTLFVYGLQVNDIIWIAVATLLSQFVLFIILGFLQIRKENIFRLSIKEMSLSWKYVKPLLMMSIPIFIGKFIFSFGKVAVNSIFGSEYLEILKSQVDTTGKTLEEIQAEYQACEATAGLVVGALAVSNNLNGIATSPINTFEEAESTIISQNLGNNNLKRAFQAFAKTFVYCFISGFVGWVLIRFIFQDQLISLFKGNKVDASQAEQFMAFVKQINNFDSWSIPSLAIAAACFGVLYGFGKTRIAAIMNIARAFVFRIPILVILLKCFPQLGVDCAGLSMGISNIAIAVMCLICTFVVLLKIKKNGFEGMTLEGSITATVNTEEEASKIENIESIEEANND